MAIRVLFVPFEADPTDNISRPGHEYLSKNANWDTSHQAKRAAIQEDGQGDFHDLLVVTYQRSIRGFLTGLGAEDQIYIRGHGLPGFGGIFDHQTHDERGREVRKFGTRNPMSDDLRFAMQNFGSTVQPYFSLTATEVVQRLRACGLRPSFAGKIKCYNCHSANDQGSFAYKLEEALSAAGFNRCSVYGYVGSLTSEGARANTPDSAQGGTHGLHKGSRVDGNNPAVSQRMGTGTDRASNRRVAVREP